MSFGREIKDFVGAFMAGRKVLGSKDDQEYKRLRNQVLKQKAEDAADPELRDLAKNKLKAQINRLNRGPKAMDPLDRAIKEQRLKYYRSLDPENQPKQPGPADSIAPRVGPQGALDTDQSVDTADNSDQTSGDMADSSYGDTGDDTGGSSDMAALDVDVGDLGDELAASKGGMITPLGNKPVSGKKKKVKGYADGGLVDDSEYSSGDDDTADEADYMDAQDASDEPETDDNSGEEASEGAIPTSATPAKTASKETPKFSYQAAHDAALAGVKYSMAHHADEAGVDAAPQGAVTDELSAQSRSARSAAARAHASGDGAVSQSEMQKVLQAVDPEGKLSESERNMAALAHVYEWTAVNKGPEAADRAAGSLTQYMRQASDRWRAMSKVAASNGDVDGTMKAIVNAYANIPTGDDLKLKMDGDKITATFTDQETGKPTEKHILSPDELLQWATKGGVGDFDSLLARSAGGRAELKAREARGDKDLSRQDKEKDRAIRERGVAAREQANELKAGADKTLKPSDEKTLLEQGDELVSSLPKEQQAQGKDINSIALTMRANNGGKGYSDAFNAAREITQVDPANPSARSFDYSLDPKTNKVIFDTSKGKFTVPVDVAKRMSAMRDANMKTAQAVLDKAKGSADRAQSTGRAVIGAGRSLYGNPQPLKGAPVLGKPFAPTVPLDEAPPGSVPNRGLGEL